MYPRSFLCEKAKTKQRTPLKQELFEIGEEAIWESQFTSFFFIVTSNCKNSMYPRIFLCEEAKLKQRTPLKKELCEIGKEAIWESRFASFFPISIIDQ